MISSSWYTSEYGIIVLGSPKSIIVLNKPSSSSLYFTITGSLILSWVAWTNLKVNN